jgi:hypothetical protein
VLQPDAQEQNAPPLDVMVAVPVASEAKSGIGGWLILPAIGMVLGPPLSLVGIIRQLSFTFGPEYAESASEYAGLPVFNGFELVGKCALMILVCVATYWFFTKRTGAPKIIIGLMIYGMVFGAIRLIWGIALFGAENSEVVVAMLRSTNIIGQVISSAIWIPYFLTSERVRNTFTRR